MNDNQTLFSFLREKYKKIPFHIYYIAPASPKSQLLYSSGEIKTKDVLPAIPGNEKYQIQSDADKTLLSFFYSGDKQVLLLLASPDAALEPQELESLHVLFSFLSLENQMKAKDAKLASMIESIRSITSSLEPQDVLNKIITQALSVIPAADAGYLQLYDEKTEELTSRAAVGFNSRLHETRIKSGESITGKVFRDSTPVIYYTREEIYAAMSDLSPENLTYIQSAIDNTKLKSMISVPLLLENKTIGVMNIQQYEVEGKLSEHDLHLLEGFAAQAAIALHNAKLYQDANERLEEISELTRQLEEKNRLLLRRAEVHEALTQFSLQNKSIAFMIQELNRMVGREIYFFDNLDSEMIPKKAYASTSMSNDEFSRLLLTKKKPFYTQIPGENLAPCYIYPIISDRVSLGCFLIPLGTPISSDDQMTIEQASYVLALELTKRKTQEEVYYKKTQELFKDLLQYKDPRLLEEAGESLGLHPDSFFSVFVLEVVSYTDLQTLEAFIHRLISKIKRRIPEKGTLIFGFHNKVTILFSTTAPGEMDETIRALHFHLLEWSQQGETPLHAGLGTFYEGIHSIAKCYDEANKSLAYMISRKKTGIMSYKKIGINRLFLTQPFSEIESFAADILSPLRSEKAQTNELEKTLFTYIKSNRSILETAEKLHIHKNTLYHRLKKIEELLELDLQNPDDFLQVLLACHLQESVL